SSWPSAPPPIGPNQGVNRRFPPGHPATVSWFYFSMKMHSGRVGGNEQPFHFAALLRKNSRTMAQRGCALLGFSWRDYSGRHVRAKWRGDATDASPSGCGSVL